MLAPLGREFSRLRAASALRVGGGVLRGDRLGGAARERHDRDHRVRARGRRERAAVADPHALGVVELAPRVGNARLGVVPHPARAHLVRTEEPEAAGPQGNALPALDAVVEIVAVAPARRATGHRLDLTCAGRGVQAGLCVDRPVRVAHVQLVGEVVVRDRLAVRVDLDPAVAVVAQQADEGPAVAHLLHHLLVPASVREGQRGTDQRRRVLSRLDQEAVSVLDRGELVHESRTVEDAVGDLCAAFKAGKLPDSFDDNRYFNVRTMKAAGAR